LILKTKKLLLSLYKMELSLLENTEIMENKHINIFAIILAYIKRVGDFSLTLFLWINQQICKTW